ncbi:MAG: PIN domain-containing protein [Candidatus Aenigmarchaeota archaeon]|nr:PIN domain-containing protein [Candidatus Aenigmarchaeota archaeon]
MILDTSFIIDLLRSDNGAVKKAEELQKSSELLLTTTITVFEIWQGTMDIKNDKKRTAISELLQSLGLLVLDFDSAKKAGEIHSRLIKKGEEIDPEDSMIAGISITRGERLLTRNIEHFKRIGELRVESY